MNEIAYSYSLSCQAGHKNPRLFCQLATDYDYWVTPSHPHQNTLFTSFELDLFLSHENIKWSPETIP